MTALEDEVPDHSVLSRLRTRLTTAKAWDGLLEQINQQISVLMLALRQVVTLTRALRIVHVNQGLSHPMKSSSIGQNKMTDHQPKRQCKLLK